MLLHFIECRTSRETRNADRTQMNSWDQHKNIYKLFTMSWELSKIKGWSIFFFYSQWKYKLMTLSNSNTDWGKCHKSQVVLHCSTAQMLHLCCSSLFDSHMIFSNILNMHVWCSTHIYLHEGQEECVKVFSDRHIERHWHVKSKKHVFSTFYHFYLIYMLK